VQIEAVDVRAQESRALHALGGACEMEFERRAEFDDGAASIRPEAHLLAYGALIAGSERRGVLGEGIASAYLEQASLFEHPHDARLDVEHECLDVALRGRAGAKQSEPSSAPENQPSSPRT
jgi:hypothetical protein